MKCFNAECHEQERYTSSCGEYAKAELKALYVYGFTSICQSLITSLSTIVIVILAGYQVMNNLMTLADFVMIHQYILTLYQPLDQLGKLYRDLKQQILDAEAMICLQNEPIDIDDKPGAPEFQISPDEQIEVQFKNVSFNYDNKQTNERISLIKDMSFTVQSDKRLGIVGSSGKYNVY